MSRGLPQPGPMLAFLVLTVLASAPPTRAVTWDDFKELFGKDYNASEEEYRRLVFSVNKLLVKVHNEEYSKGHVLFKLKMNSNGDKLHQEMAAMPGAGMRVEKGVLNAGDVLEGLMDSEDPVGAALSLPVVVNKTFSGPVPPHVDWREKGFNDTIWQQGSCGSCWAFAAVGAIEAQYLIKYKRRIELSAQNLLDCATKKDGYTNEGCLGGLEDYAYEYIMDHGVALERDYADVQPSKEGRCKFNSSLAATNITGWRHLLPYDEDNLQRAVAFIGPVAVNIDASLYTFQLYHSGIYSDARCSTSNLTHAVLVVGYGSENGTDYWLVKNSYGDRWGEGGYIRMARNKGNSCGIATYPSYPLGAHPVAGGPLAPAPAPRAPARACKRRGRKKNAKKKKRCRKLRKKCRRRKPWQLKQNRGTIEGNGRAQENKTHTS